MPFYFFSFSLKNHVFWPKFWKGGTVKRGFTIWRIAQNGVPRDGSFIFHNLMLGEVLLCHLTCHIQLVVNGFCKFLLKLKGKK